MPVSRLKPKKGNARPGKLLPKHRLLCDEYLANGMQLSLAARTVGYKRSTPVVVQSILDRPEVRHYLECRLGELRERQFVRTAELLAKMKRLNDFNLMHAMISSRSGGMLEVSADDYDRVADEIGDCVTEMEVVTVEYDDGSKESKIRIKLMDKDKNFDRELEYHGIKGPGQNNIQINVGGGLDWDELCDPSEEEDVIEGRIEGRVK